VNQAEIETAAALLRHFATEHADVLTGVDVNHVGVTVVLLDKVGPTARPESPRPSDRMAGMCPCEIADRVRASQ
jgi:hypothetical protein